VQGVFFRTFVQRWAEQLKLTGYVCNLPDGTVEVRAEGEKQQLEKLVGYLQKGTPPARVDKVVTSWAENTGNFLDFRVRY
jgi:acylphosphatase